MSDKTILEIQLSRVHPSIGPEEKSWNVHRGGPEVLLRWLETQLGLLFEPVAHSSRVTQYAVALDPVGDACFSESLGTDRWSTAAELLERRGELRLAGWDEMTSSKLPVLPKDLARAAEKAGELFPDEAERLARVLTALEAGQSLPPHRCGLQDPLERWPAKWQGLLRQLTTEEAPEPSPAAREGSSLREAQQQVLCGEVVAIAPDASLRWVTSTSILTACEVVASALSKAPKILAETAVCCEDDQVALCLDGCFEQLGLPTMGAALRSRAHPIFQILPLALSLCWEPVDPGLLLDLLSLPVSPIPRKAARQLAKALREQPGLGSAEWEEAMGELCGEQSDPEGKLKTRLQDWLGAPRVSRGQAVPAQLIAERCALVARWAAGYAAVREEPEDEVLVAALKTAATQAAELGELAQDQGGDLTEPQLLRLRDATLQQGGKVKPHLTAAGGATLASSLAELSGRYSRLVWLGLGTDTGPTSRWTTAEREALQRAGLELDDGSRKVAALREAERRGFCNVSEALLAVSLPGEEEKQPHPLWVRIQSGLEQGKQGKPVLVDDLLIGGRTNELRPWPAETKSTVVEPCQPRRPVWYVPADLLAERSSSSATELENRLACPLKWTFHYLAGLRASPIASLPDSFLLKGTFCHSVLQAVFGKGGPLPSPEDAVSAVSAVFDRRLPLDAAPLAQPDRLMERHQLRDELLAATRTFAQALRDGHYTVEGMEVSIEGKMEGRKLSGYIDCIAKRKDGSEAIIDFKYAGRNKYPGLIKDGRAVQLATYAYSRSQTPGQKGTFPAVAYLILADGLFYAPSGSCPSGLHPAAKVEAPAIAEVWDRFAEALRKANTWLEDGAIPARPLQHSDDWPEGADLVLSPADKKEQMPAEQETCKYCDFGSLCGLRERW